MSRSPCEAPCRQNARVCDQSPRSTCPSTPYQLTSSRQNRLRPSDGCALRNAIMPLKKRKMSLFLGKQVPIEPGSLIILVPRVVVTVLGVHVLVTRTEHRSPVRDHQDREEVFYLLFSQLHNLRWHALIALPSTVP